MLKFSILAFLACVLLAAASPCPFRQLQDAATAGTLSKREAEIVEKMKRDPSYIPALDPEAQPLFKRAALPTAEADLVSNSAEEFKPLEKKQSLPSGLPDVCGGLSTSYKNHLLSTSQADSLTLSSVLEYAVKLFITR